MIPIWRSPQSDGDEIYKDISQFADLSALPDLILRLLIQRNISKPENIQAFLYPKISDIKNPFLLAGMEQAVNRIIEAFKRNEKICIYADFDLDGTSGLALLWFGLRGLGWTHLVYHQPKRLSDGYGFHLSTVEELKAQGVDLIITVDVGITAVEAVQRAQDLGIDVILTDHHLPLETLPPAYVIINPNSGRCSSGLGYLCGAGVAFYLLRALKRAFHEDQSLPDNQFDLRSVLEFFTIATLTDMVPLIEDNRVLVKMGLAAIEKTQKKGLVALINELGLSNRPLTSQDVAIRLAPKLNALSRMESSILPIDLFLVEREDLAKSMVQTMMANNSSRVQLQSEAESEAINLLKDWPHDDFLFVASKNFHRGVLGLIATKLTQSFNKAAFVGSIGDDGMIVGSARIPQGKEISLVEALKVGQEYLSRFGGHAAAAGFELAQKHVDEFVADMSRFFTLEKQTPRPIELLYDGSSQLVNLTPDLMKWHDFLGPYGVGFPPPVFRFDRLIVISVNSLKGGHYKLKLTDSFGSSQFEGLLFSPPVRHLENIEKIQSGETDYVDILAEIQWNYFAGRKTIQLLIKDIKNSAKE